MNQGYMYRDARRLSKLGLSICSSSRRLRRCYRDDGVYVSLFGGLSLVVAYSARALVP